MPADYFGDGKISIPRVAVTLLHRLAQRPATTMQPGFQDGGVGSQQLRGLVRAEPFIESQLNDGPLWFRQSA